MAEQQPASRSSGDGLGPSGWLGQAAVLVPVKSFADAKVRLAPALAPADRARLAREMATAVVVASALPCRWRWCATTARSPRGPAGSAPLVVWEPGRGLNGAVEAGVEQLGRAGVRRVVVAHGDLPHAAGLAALAGEAGETGVLLVPDRRRDGTNVASIPTGAGFRFSYGPGSFARHQVEAVRLGLAVTVVDDPLLAFDVDVPDDLDALSRGA